MKALKLIKIIFLSYMLFFVQLNVTILPFKNAQPQKSFVEVSLTHSGVYAQMDSMTSIAKSEDNDFKRHYLPMIVMLGIGTMSFFILKNLERRSPDMIIFLVGGIIYFANVVMGWTEENKAFKALPDEIQLETQTEALELQKKSFEDVLKIAEKRYKMQMASAAGFAASTIAAMMSYMKEKSNTAQLQSAVSQNIAEVQSACARDPQVASNQWLMHPTMEPLMTNCTRQTTQITNCLTQVQADASQIAALNERPADPLGSDNANTLLEEANDRLAQHANSCDYPATVNQHRRLQQAAMRGVYQENSVIEKKSIFFKENKTGIVYEMIPRKLKRESDKSLTYMEKYFTDEELKDFSKEDISLLNHLKIDINLIDLLIAESFAWGRLRSLIGMNSSATEAAVNTTSTVLGNEAGGLAENAAESVAYSSCDNTPNLSNCSTSSGQAAQEAYVQFQGQAMDAATGTVVGEVAKPAVRSTFRAIGGFIARRAATVAVVAASAAAATVAGVAVAPVVITGVGLAVTAATVYELGQAGYAAYEAYSKNSMAQERLESTVDDMGDYAANMAFYKPHKTLIDTFIPKAFAFSGVDVANNGRQALSESTGEGLREVDRWIFNAKGRMIIYGAVTALSGVILANTKAMIDNLKEDIEKIDGIIQGMEGSQSNHHRLYKGIDTIFDFFVDEANASKLQTVDLGTRLPCIQPMRNKKNSCANLKVLYRRLTPRDRFKEPEIIGQAFNTITEIGNGLNGQRKISPQTMERIEVLAAAQPFLVGVMKNTEKIVNRERRRGGEKPLNFKGLQNLFMKRMYKRTENIFKKYKVTERDMASIANGSVKQAKRTYNKRKIMPNFDQTDDVRLDNSGSFDNSQSFSNQNGNNGELVKSGESYLLDDINKDSNQDLFKIISRRYIMIRNSRIKK